MTRRKSFSILAGALVFLAAWTIGIVTSVGERDSVALPLVVVATVLAGALACDWRVLFLAVAVIPIAATQACDTSTPGCEINAPAYAAVFFAPFAAALLAVGVLLGKAIARRRPSRP